MAVRGISEPEDKRIWKFEQREGIHYLWRKESYPGIFLSFLKTTENVGGLDSSASHIDVAEDSYRLCFGVKSNRRFGLISFIFSVEQSKKRQDKDRTFLDLLCQKWRRKKTDRQTSFVNKFIYVIKCALLSAL